MRSSRLRPAHAALAAASLLLLVVPPSAGADQAGSIRVLIYEGPGSVKIQSGGREARFEAGRGGVVRDGDRVRDVWRVPASRNTRVGDRQVRGDLLVQPNAERAGRLRVIEEVDLEAYVEGVLTGEMPASWADEALAAQAVASRTYVLHQRSRRADSSWHVAATTAHQVYAQGTGVPRSIRRAVARTRGEVLLFRGQPILAAFHSASGGQTASASEVWGESLPYLVSQDVSGEDDSPDTFWRAAISRNTLGQLLASAGQDVGRPRSFEVLERTKSGRVALLRVRGSEGQADLTGRRLRAVVGENTLRSALFDVRGGEVASDSDYVVFVGTGRGHGVGMSQWGARSMARAGRGYKQILETFYPGTHVGSRAGQATSRH